MNSYALFLVVYLPEFITCSLLAQKVQTHMFKIEMTAQN